MIDVKELRINNLVLGYYTFDDENDEEQEVTHVCRVLAIDSVGAHEYPLWVELDKGVDVEEYDGFVPIPLTEEWLLRFGFNKDNNYTWFNTEVQVMEREQGFYIWLGKDLKLTTVHHFQNLHYSLFGKELELKPEL